ncbi:MAG: polysaccharide deacetylase family protein [Candidatus Methylomirabilis oxygeniifera]|nr:MAG: polysaccharide deacetylase family protein [Candidatus Methylomirabilis oxyfera]
MHESGILVISLDFELHWGVRDKRRVEDYRGNLLGARTVIPRLLELFTQYDIHATWAIVGFLFFRNRCELMRGLPTTIPQYTDRRLSPYDDLDAIGIDEQDDPFHYASSLITLIASRPNQEIGSHSFSHYYCLESGQTIEMFESDLQAAIQAAKPYGLSLDSMVFPRNQVNDDYIPVCRANGIKAFRGRPRSWTYAARNQEEESRWARLLRLIDAYINLSGHTCYSSAEIAAGCPCNIPGSRFVRPYSPRFRALEPLRLHRIKSDLSYAAKNKQVYHLFWHPHNFGKDIDRNLAFLRSVLEHFQVLRHGYGMQSLNMRDVVAGLTQEIID